MPTAAGLWTCGVVGLAFGAGFYEGGLTATVLILIIEIFFSRVAEQIRHPSNFKIIVSYHSKEALDVVQRFFKDRHVAIAGLQISGRNDNGSTQSGYEAMISLRASTCLDPQPLLTQIRTIEGVRSAELLLVTDDAAMN